MKEKVHIISHSHLDREWYLPYEQHHMRVIELLDNLLDIFDHDPDFKSFHLDGQTIVLDDYLEVKPEKKEQVQKAIKDGKLKIGPFYILQDDYLISSEANVRNALIGMQESKKWGDPVMLGYFPDTFGNMGQTPQMMKEMNIDVAAFGRGVKPTGFNNAVIDEQYVSQFSEMKWQGPDQSEILGILFANWYSNGNEIPVDKQEALVFWQQKLADAEKYASTNHLLMMNGCDHQPLQKDISQAIKVANELFPDYEFIHSNFADYIAAIKPELPENLSTVTGELTSQETDGWYTLVNTASSRIYLKQKNAQVQAQLENISEPLATMAAEISGHYPHKELEYAWKLLMQNHPHDSICGCSVDEVHREMVTRFDKALEVGLYVANEALDTLVQSVDTSSFSEESRPFIVWNTAGQAKGGPVEVTIEWKRRYFSEAWPPRLHRELSEEGFPEFQVVNAQGEVVPHDIQSCNVEFGYDLPKDGFRIPYMAQVVKVVLYLEEQAPISWQSFALQAVTQKSAPSTSQTIINEKDSSLENHWIKVSVAQEGTLTILDKTMNKAYEGMLCFEDVGDIGNEYVFYKPKEDQGIRSTQFPHQIEILTNNEFVGEMKLIHQLELPISADDQLELEQQAMVGFNSRQAQRSKKTKPFTIETIVKVEKDSAQIQFESTFVNEHKDHRLRVLFPTNMDVNHHFAESIYEVVKRPNQPSDSWKNPDHSQRKQAFVTMEDEENAVVVGGVGLSEYEIVNRTIELTLLRSIGEMGDWGYFPTPEAQCLGEHRVQYSVEVGCVENKNKMYAHTKNIGIPFSVKQTTHHTGSLPSKGQFLTIDSESFQLTALKYSQNNQIITRGFNLSNEDSTKLSIMIPNKTPYLANLLEEKKEQEISNIMKPAEILTFVWE